MARPEPIYTAENCRSAYQLNWSLSIFPLAEMPAANEWLDPLRQATESDCVRILECRPIKSHTLQFFVSTQPHVSPAEIVRSIKGRLQYLIRNTLPRAFRRNYRIESVGEVNNNVLQAYVARQAEQHVMADSRIQERIATLQYDDPRVMLANLRQHHSWAVHLQFAPCI